MILSHSLRGRSRLECGRIQPNPVGPTPPGSINRQTILRPAIKTTCPHAQLLRRSHPHPRHPSSAPNIRKKCFVLRTSTERQEAVDAGFAELVGVNPKKVVSRIWDWIENDWSVPARKSPFGDGTTAKKSVEILKKAGYC